MEIRRSNSLVMAIEDYLDGKVRDLDPVDDEPERDKEEKEEEPDEGKGKKKKKKKKREVRTIRRRWPGRGGEESREQGLGWPVDQG